MLVRACRHLLASSSSIDSICDQFSTSSEDHCGSVTTSPTSWQTSFKSLLAVDLVLSGVLIAFFKRGREITIVCSSCKTPLWMKGAAGVISCWWNGFTCHLLDFWALFSKPWSSEISLLRFDNLQFRVEVWFAPVHLCTSTYFIVLFIGFCTMLMYGGMSALAFIQWSI